MNCFKLFILLALFVLSGCMVRQLPAYEPGTAVPPGKVLVIAQLDLRPGVEQGAVSKTHFTVGSPEADEVRVFISPAADVPVDKEAIVPISLKGASQMNLSFAHPSLVLMEPGVSYIRMGEFTLSVTHAWRRNAMGEMRGDAKVEKLTLYGDIKLDIPATAKAVYIGTLRYEHDGVESRKVTVVDEYKKTMKALDKMKLGISSKDVKKRLARVIRDH